MILFALGLPGRLTDWCTAVIAQLAASAGEVRQLTWPPLVALFSPEPVAPILEQLGRALVADEADHFAVNAIRPDEALRRVLSEREIPFLIPVDDPHSSVAEIAATTGAAPTAVVRALADSYPCLMPFANLPTACVLTAEHARSNPRQAVLAIANHFGMMLEPKRAAAIAGALGSPAAPVPIPAADAPGADRQAAATKTLDGALMPYHRHFLNGAFGELVWTRDLFIGDTGRSPIEPIDVAGNPRTLIYGPYIRLPPGYWTTRVVLGVSPETAGSVFLIDAFAGKQLAQATLVPERPGVHAIDLNFLIEPPSSAGLEIRVWVVSGNARGRLAFGHVVLQLQAGIQATPNAPSDDFAAALEL